ncbi:hypothetical protein ANO14919_042660 [Xylariales sp. No.14919]|nr:hypothetical protein ANO14919_042660 [Xylariales sp. No.14919]
MIPRLLAHVPVRLVQFLLVHPTKSQDLLASTKIRIRQTSTLRLRVNGDVVGLAQAQDRAKALTGCHIHRHLGGFLLVKGFLLVVPGPGITLDTPQHPKAPLVLLART